MKKVISLALFGDSTRKDGSGMNYHAYLPSYVLACNNLFESNEGWELHIHVDQQTLAGDYGAMLMKMNHAHLAHVVAMPAAELTKAMLWRMKPVFQHGVGYVFCRDIDCIPMPRDRAICDTFSAATMYFSINTGDSDNVSAILSNPKLESSCGKSAAG